MENNKNNLISISELSDTVKNITPAKSKEDYLYLETSGIKENIINNYLHDTPQKINDFKEKTGEKTVPQIYRSDGKHIGDYNGLKHYIEVHLKEVVNKMLRGF